MLRGITHGDAGFPDIDKGALGLKRLGCAEAYGWIWITGASAAAPDIAGWLGELAADFDWIDAGRLKIAHEETKVRAVNWKILIEGGIESYHFRIAHKDSIGPFFQDNLSSYRVFGPHIRSILPRAGLDAMIAQAEGKLVAEAGNQSGLFHLPGPRNCWSRKTISSGSRAFPRRPTGP